MIKHNNNNYIYIYIYTPSYSMIYTCTIFRRKADAVGPIIASAPGRSSRSAGSPRERCGG